MNAHIVHIQHGIQPPRQASQSADTYRVLWLGGTSMWLAGTLTSSLEEAKAAATKAAQDGAAAVAAAREAAESQAKALQEAAEEKAKALQEVAAAQASALSEQARTL